ncbi:toll/interleukin-1 receptor domain-containing protein [Georgenia sp. EYE_87]|uniref:toll/interleukin-1 receptor domain-containing protein n=1 Tax=Georgenia sp. EYE_87 TaxID=2853448 RepID=UPI00200617C5|nr:toll/interleukin-1 receptor domain-containing protein [Georgenia sp. EYE_87]MCK6211583.1 toll/interleukin-1 receptor domain-containing protein [Georgenia sp. EYE_87]
MRVFLSYRREDSAAHAGRLADELRRRLGRSDVFLDVAEIRPGSDFTDAIDTALRQSDAVLVVIGPRWLSAAVADGRPRLDDPQDYVRREVAAALDGSLPVVPVLVGGARLPRADELPEDLVPLARRQAIALDDDTWLRDVQALLDLLEGRREAPTRRRLALLVGAGVLAGAAVATVVAVALLRPDPGEPDGASGTDGETGGVLTGCPDPDETWERLLGPDGTASGVVEEADGGTLEFTVTDVFAQDNDDGSWEVVVTSVMTNNLDEVRNHGDWVYDQLEVARIAYETKTCYSVESQLPEPGQRSRARVGYEVTEDPAGGLRLTVGDNNYYANFALTPGS